MEREKHPKAYALALTAPEIALVRLALAEHVEREGESQTAKDVGQLLRKPLQMRALAELRHKDGEPV